MLCNLFPGYFLNEELKLRPYAVEPLRLYAFLITPRMPEKDVPHGLPEIAKISEKGTFIE